MRTGEPVLIGSLADRLRRFPALPAGPGPTFALGCLPLIVDDEAIGGLAFSFGADQVFDEERRATKVALARQAAQALQRARMYEAVRVEILLVDQLESGAVLVRESTCDLAVLADEVVAAARVRAPELIRIGVEAPPDVPTVRCDEDNGDRPLACAASAAARRSPASPSSTSSTARPVSLRPRSSYTRFSASTV